MISLYYCAPKPKVDQRACRDCQTMMRAVGVKCHGPWYQRQQRGQGDSDKTQRVLVSCKVKIISAFDFAACRRSAVCCTSCVSSFCHLVKALLPYRVDSFRYRRIRDIHHN